MNKMICTIAILIGFLFVTSAIAVGNPILWVKVYNFASNEGTNLLAYKHDAYNHQCYQGLPDSLDVCGNVFEITNDTDLDFSDNNRESVRVESTTTIRHEHGWLKLVGKVDRDHLQKIVWKTEIFYEYYGAGYDYDIYLWDYIDNRWVLMDDVNYNLGWGKELSINISTSEVSRFVNSQGETTLLVWGWIEHGTHGVGTMDVDYIRLDAQYSGLSLSL